MALLVIRAASGGPRRSVRGDRRLQPAPGLVQAQRCARTGLNAAAKGAITRFPSDDRSALHAAEKRMWWI